MSARDKRAALFEAAFDLAAAKLRTDLAARDKDGAEARERICTAAREFATDDGCMPSPNGYAGQLSAALGREHRADRPYNWPELVAAVRSLHRALQSVHTVAATDPAALVNELSPLPADARCSIGSVDLYKLAAGAQREAVAQKTSDEWRRIACGLFERLNAAGEEQAHAKIAALHDTWRTDRLKTERAELAQLRERIAQVRAVLDSAHSVTFARGTVPR